MNIYAVIMAGGVGERFWPQSRLKLPKQFINIVGKKTMIQQTLERISPLIPQDRILIISNKSQASLIDQQLPSLKKNQKLLEPFGRNTAPCIGLAAAFLGKKDPEAVMVVLPSDHIIGNCARFLEILKESALMACREQSLITIGVKPNGPETGYGYIHYKEAMQSTSSVKFYQVQRFIEKPNRKTAELFLREGGYLWNSGMFVWRVKDILEAMSIYLPEIYEKILEVQKHIEKSSESKAILKMYEKVPKISIDHGIMEKAANIVVAEGDFEWDDVGSWSSIERHYEKDASQNIVVGDHVGIDTENSIILTQNGIVATCGVMGLIIIQTPDGVLVISKDRAQEVKNLIEMMKGHEKYQRYL